MKTLAPCDHDECPPTRCTRTPSDEAVVCKELLGELEAALSHALEAAKRNDWNNRPDTARNIAHSITFLRAAIGTERAYNSYLPNDKVRGGANKD